MGKDDAPQGPDFNKLLKQMEGYAKQNQQVFTDALKFGKDQFSKGQEWVDKLEQFGMDAMGRLGNEAKNFKTGVEQRVGALDKAGAAWGKAATDIYGQNKALADKVTGKLLPEMGTSAELGGKLLDRYTEQGIPFQDEYIAKLAGWDTSGRREDRAAQAVSDVNMTSEAAIENERRRLEGFGIDPSQTRSTALSARLEAQKAVAQAQAANQQRQAVEQEGIQLGGVASGMYDESLAAGRGLVESAGTQARTLAEIARQPGADYLATLANLGQYRTGVGQLEQAGGAAGFDMSRTAEGFGQAGKAAGAAQQLAASNYGSGVYDQAGNLIKSGAGITQSGYGTAGQLHANDLQAYEQNQKNSLGGQIGQLAGIAAPFVMDAFMPGAGTALKAATGGMFGAGGMFGKKAAPATASGYGMPAAGTNLLNNQWGEGGPVRREDSPSGGGIPDDVHGVLDAGEFVVDRDTTRWFGEKHLRNMQAQAKKGLGIPEAA